MDRSLLVKQASSIEPKCIMQVKAWGHGMAGYGHPFQQPVLLLLNHFSEPHKVDVRPLAGGDHKQPCAASRAGHPASQQQHRAADAHSDSAAFCTFWIQSREHCSNFSVVLFRALCRKSIEQMRPVRQSYPPQCRPTVQSNNIKQQGGHVHTYYCILKAPACAHCI